MITLGLIVLRTANVEKMLAFYRELGLTFVEEKHGSGPVHYACELPSMMIEIFPGEAGTAPDRKNGGATMLGFNVESVDIALAKLHKLGIELISPAKDSAWGRRAVLFDPDGRAIELNQPKRT